MKGFAPLYIFMTMEVASELLITLPKINIYRFFLPFFQRLLYLMLCYIFINHDWQMKSQQQAS